MFFDDSTLPIYDRRRFIYRNDSRRKNHKRNRRKTNPGRCSTYALREHPFLPKEVTDRIIAFASSFGFKVVLLAKAGKLVRSNRSVADMTAYCCAYYIDNGLLKVGLAKYDKGKISLLSELDAGHRVWLDNFALSYRSTAEDIKYSVLTGAIEPAIVPGLFLKSSNNVTCC